MSQRNIVSVTLNSPTVTRVSGDIFAPDPAWVGRSTTITGVPYIVTSVQDIDHLTLAIPYEDDSDSAAEAIIQDGNFYTENLLKFLPETLQLSDVTGDLASLCQIVALSIDELNGMIADLPKLFDIDNIPNKYLPYIADILGYPLASLDSVDSQRFQLKNAVAFYQRKGLKDSFKVLFYALGYQVNLIDLWTSDYTNFYRAPIGLLPNLPVPSDSNLLVENGGCWFKSPHFGIEVTSFTGAVTNPEILAYLRQRVELVRPAHTVLNFLQLLNSFEDTYPPISDPVTLNEMDVNSPVVIKFQYPPMTGDWPAYHTLAEFRAATFP